MEKVAFINCAFYGGTDENGVSVFPNINYPSRLFSKFLFYRCLFADPVGGPTVRPGDPNHAFGPGVGSPSLPATPVEQAMYLQCLFLSHRDRHPRWGHGTSGWKINCLTVNYGRRPNEFGFDPLLVPYATAAEGLAARPTEGAYWPAYDAGEVYAYQTVGGVAVKGAAIPSKLATRVSFVGNSRYAGLDTEDTLWGIFFEGVPPLSKAWWSNNWSEGAAETITAADIAEAMASGATDPTAGVTDHPIALPANLSYFHDALNVPISIITDRATMEQTVLTNAGPMPHVAQFLNERAIHEASTRQGARVTDQWRTRVSVAALAPSLSANTVKRYAKPGTLIGTLAGFAEAAIVPLLDTTDGNRLATLKRKILVGPSGVADRRNVGISINVLQDWYGQTPRQVSTPFTIQVSDDADALSIDALATSLSATRKWKAANVTRSGANCTAWASDIGTHSLPAIGVPTYNASGTGCANPFVSLDGDDAFRTSGGANPANMASGTSPCWMVALMRDRASDLSNTRTLFGYGGTGASDARWIGSLPNGGTRRFRYGKGGTGGLTDTNSNLRTSGWVLVVANFTSTPGVSGQVDGIATASGSLAFSSATTGVRTAIGCDLGSTAGQFWVGDLAFELYGLGNLDASQMAEALKTGWAYLQGLVV